MEQDSFASGARFGRGNLVALLAVVCAVVGWIALVAFRVIVDRHTPATGRTLICGSTFETFVGVLGTGSVYAALAGIVIAVTAFVRGTDRKGRTGLALVACLFLLAATVAYVATGYGCDYA